ncbi:MAG: putative membrane protein, partial [Porticoccaceae bacterium]
MSTLWPSSTAWWPWAEKALLFLGLALTLSGVVCFFAWNWDAMPGLVKLAIVQAGIVACCVAAYQKKIATLPGKAAITAAAVLVGVFLAVFGQVYQTGADAYQLFVGWALLILPWVVMCRLAGLWVLRLAIVNVAVSL